MLNQILYFLFGDPHSYHRYIVFGAIAGTVTGVLATYYTFNVPIAAAILTGISAWCAGLPWTIGKPHQLHVMASYQATKRDGKKTAINLALPETQYQLKSRKSSVSVVIWIAIIIMIFLGLLSTCTDKIVIAFPGCSSKESQRQIARPIKQP